MKEFHIPHHRAVMNQQISSLNIHTGGFEHFSVTIVSQNLLQIDGVCVLFPKVELSSIPFEHQDDSCVGQFSHSMDRSPHCREISYTPMVLTIVLESDNFLQTHVFLFSTLLRATFDFFVERCSSTLLIHFFECIFCIDLTSKGGDCFASP
jgi:hypothetical protein